MKAIRAIACMLPLLVFVGGIGKAELHLRSAETYQLPIAGFDPRDVLRGRYLQFRIEVPEDSECSQYTEDCVACVVRNESGPPSQLSLVHGAQADECDAVLPTQFVYEQQRLYVPEARAAQLERELMDSVREQTAAAEFAIDASGAALVKNVLIDGNPVLSGP